MNNSNFICDLCGQKGGTGIIKCRFSSFSFCKSCGDNRHDEVTKHAMDRERKTRKDLGYNRVYAIIRCDNSEHEMLIDARIKVIKIVEDADYAQSEVERLNQINKDHFYFFQITRMDKNEITTG